VLWLAVHLPDLILDAVSRGGAADLPVAVVEGRAGRRCILACSEAARAGGVRPGMSLVAAWALLPGLRPLARDRRLERDVVLNSCIYSYSLTSFISQVSGQGLLLEVEGSLGLHGGLEGLWGLVARGFSDLGYRASLAVAPTPTGAWLLGREGRGGRVVDMEALAGRLAPVPLACADLPAGQLAELAGMGVTTLGALTRLPRDGLSRRLGPAVVAMMDRALGQVPDPREPWTPPRTFSTRVTLPAPVSEVEALLFPLHHLVLDLVGYLRAVGGGVERVTVGLGHPRLPVTRLEVGLAGPSRDPGHLQAILHERLQRTPLPGPVEEVSLRAGRVVELAGANLDLFGPTVPAAETWQRLVDRLSARLGPQAVQGIALAADHRPERAWTLAPEAGAGLADQPRGRRPLWLLQVPRALETAEGLPVRGGTVVLREGPERIETGWWDGEDVVRDYYVAETPGGERLWVYRERRPPHRWFLHGIFA
jgi:protein ImuB